MQGVNEDGKNQVWETGMVDGVIRQLVGQEFFPRDQLFVRRGS